MSPSLNGAATSLNTKPLKLFAFDASVADRIGTCTCIPGPCPWKRDRVLIDGEASGVSHGLDIDSDG